MGTASAADITVNNSTGPVADFTSLQAAVDAAEDGDTIIVYSGIYKENVDVNKELAILSQSGNPEDTVVQAPGWYGEIFNITANNVTINGFKVEGGDQGIILDGVQYNNISNNRLFGNSVAIVLNSSSNNILHNNRCSHLMNGISISYSNNNFLSNNSFSAMEFCFFMRHSNNNILIGNSIGGEHPFLLEYSCNNKMYNNSISGGWVGAKLLYSSNTTMTNNSISGYDAGIGVSHSNNTTMSNNYVSGMWGIGMHSSSYCIMSNNTVSTHGGDGFGLGNSNNNILKDNTVIEEWVSGDRSHSFYLGSSNNNILTGNIARRTKLDDGWGNIHLNNSNSNLIYNNYFNSTNNVYDNGNNIWNITKTPGTNIIGGPFLGGNYWSDYTGNDTDWDGMGDTLLPYNCEGQIVNGGDYLPLVTPAGPAPAKKIQATVDINPGVLNPKSEGKWVTVYIGLPACYDVKDIDVSTIMLMGSLPAESSSSEVGDGDCNGKPDLMVKFDRKELISLLDAENMELTVTGKMTDGSMFEGTDTIRVLIKVK